MDHRWSTTIQYRYLNWTSGLRLCCYFHRETWNTEQPQKWFVGTVWRLNSWLCNRWPKTFLYRKAPSGRWDKFWWDNKAPTIVIVWYTGDHGFTATIERLSVYTSREDTQLYKVSGYSFTNEVIIYLDSQIVVAPHNKEWSFWNGALQKMRLNKKTDTNNNGMGECGSSLLQKRLGYILYICDARQNTWNLVVMIEKYVPVWWGNLVPRSSEMNRKIKIQTCPARCCWR